MQLTVIGCSPAWPNPGSAHSGYVVSEDGKRVLLDCGPGVLGRLRTTELLPVDAVVITHFHLDHWGDLVPWVWMRAHDANSPARVELWVPPDGGSDLEAFALRFGNAGMFDQAFEVCEYADETEFEAGGFRVVPRSVEHYGTKAFSLRVTAPGSGAVLAYSGDTAPCPGVRATAAGADLFLCEATLADPALDATPRGHLSDVEALSIADGPALLTHRPAELELTVPAQLATDGLTVDVTT